MSTALKEITKMVGAIQKKFKVEATDHNFELHGAISTGIPRLDQLTGIGGIPRGRVTELVGQPSSGKTSLALQTLKQAQAVRDADSGKLDVVIDLEHSITPAFMQGFGINTDWVVHLRPDSAEEALQYARDLPKTGKVDVLIFDSVGAAQTTRSQMKDVGEVDVASIAKMMHDSLRSIVKTAENVGTTLIFINHITYKIGVKF